VTVSGGGSALVDALNSRAAGTTFCINSGTYSAPTGGLPLQDGDVLNGAGTPHPGTPGGSRPSVFIQGAGYTVLTGGNNVTIRDVDVTDANTNSNCQDAPSCGEVVAPNSGWKIIGSRIHHGDAQCMGGAAPSLVIEDSEFDHCGTRFDGPDNNGFASAIKSITAFTIRNSYVHDNNQGIWCDRDCDGGEFIVTGNYVFDNCSFGIHYENTYFTSSPAKATISDNVAKGNAWCSPPGPKSDIGIVSAQNATVSNNQVGPSPAHGATNRGIVFYDRGLGAPTGSATNNRLNGDTIEGCGKYPVTCSSNS
jgi:hypothetical protein